MKITQSSELATKFLSEVTKYGWIVERCSDQIVTISKTFAPGDLKAFAICDSEAFSLLTLVPLKGGSVWGTDGGSIGGYVAVQNGKYVLNKSGTNGVRFVKTLIKLMEKKSI